MVKLPHTSRQSRDPPNKDVRSGCGWRGQAVFPRRQGRSEQESMDQCFLKQHTSSFTAIKKDIINVGGMAGVCDECVS